METSGTGAGSPGPFVGGTIAGIGVGLILLAAFEQYTTYNLDNFSRLSLALGLVAIVAGGALAHNARRKPRPDK